MAVRYAQQFVIDRRYINVSVNVVVSAVDIAADVVNARGCGLFSGGNCQVPTDTIRPHHSYNTLVLQRH